MQKRDAALSTDGHSIGELLAIVASEASQYPHIGSAKQKAAWDEIKRREAWLEDRSRVEREIAGALRSAVLAHGPITVENHSSAAKRVYSALKAVRRGT